MNKNQTLKKDLIEAWKRYLNKTNTCDDLTLILDSIRNDDQNQEFKAVFNKAWDKAMNDLQPTHEEKEIYRKEAAQLLAEYEIKNQKSKTFSSTQSIVGGRFRKIWYAAAAALLLGLLIPAVYYSLKPKTEQMVVQYVEKVTQRGEIMTIFLPDQTKVMLNAGSRIKYPADFNGDERSVELHGEALFSVISDPIRPFIVKTESMNIKVLGTVFNVKEYNEDCLSSVSVASGKVEVGLDDEKVILGQNQQIKMDKATGNVETITIDAATNLSWTNGTLYFYRTPIREVVNILNRQYSQVDIELDEGEYSYLITGEYENEYTAIDILKSILYITGLKCRKTGNKYILYSD